MARGRMPAHRFIALNHFVYITRTHCVVLWIALCCPSSLPHVPCPISKIYTLGDEFRDSRSSTVMNNKNIDAVRSMIKTGK
ncbi:hypothetical protein EVAR_68462_1 [Eumeta japonica]|uniref:Secreted protein n=1 Tax=Eumeta variegata TaxID=151549 RepID=A0A4C2A8C3_EUMVA|nr:hypothetical protein EVAR_68462_1 [Eumeta japonica]